MMNYKLVHETSGDILETPTNEIIRSDVHRSKGQEKALCKELNMGGGFDGWTPLFFLTRIPKVQFTKKINFKNNS